MGDSPVPFRTLNHRTNFITSCCHRALGVWTIKTFDLPSQNIKPIFRNGIFSDRDTSYLDKYGECFSSDLTSLCMVPAHVLSGLTKVPHKVTLCANRRYFRKIIKVCSIGFVLSLPKRI